MRSPSLTELHRLAVSRLLERCPDHPYPESSVRRYSDKSANALTRAIIDFLNYSGHQAERISVMGRPVDGRKVVIDVLGHAQQSGSVSWQRSHMLPGTADISATIQGRSIKIEVKHGKDRQSDAQRRYQAAVERSGGIYYIARDFESFYKWYNQTFINHG